MGNSPEERSSKAKLDKATLHEFFISHLNKIYSAKTHLVTRLPKVAGHAHFSDLRHAIQETVDDVEKQIARMDLIYTLLDSANTSGDHSGLVGLVDDAFRDIERHAAKPELRDMSILFYLHNIESMELASFQILRIAAVKLKNKQVKQLILENYDEAKADRTLMLLIAAKYVTSV